MTENNQSRKSSPVAPLLRQWVRMPYGRNYTSKPYGLEFTVVSYNILAQDILNVHPELYVDNDPVALNWPHRCERLVTEIHQLRPDILCLQEVQQSHLWELKAHFEDLNFDQHLYKQKNGSHGDGCAIFFNSELFELVDSHYVEYYQPNVEVCVPMAR